MGEPALVLEAFELIDRLDTLTAPLEVQHQVHALVARHGYDYFTVTRLPQPGDRLAPNVLLSIWPPGWLQHYDRSGFYRADPCVRHCYTTIEPFDWASVHYYPETAAHARRVMAEAVDHGMAHGFCVPIHDALGFQAAVSLAGRHADLDPSLRRVLHLVGIYAWGAADRTVRRPPKRRATLLSARERDVLSYAAKGYKAAQIADLLRIGDETVVHHLKSARIKLGTANTTHSVVEAMRRREISV